MKFSFFMMPVHHPSDSPTLSYQRDIGLIHLADELDYDEFFIGEHHSGGWENMPAPEMALAMAAAKAHRIALGTSVTDLPFHHPFHVAERFAFLDHLTRGRAILGVGPSQLVSDKQLFAISQDRLYPMMEESVDIIVKLLESDKPFDYDGQFWKFENMRLQLRSYRQPRMPIAVASASGTPSVLEMAGKHGLMVLSAAVKQVEGRRGLVDNWKVIEEAAKKHGKVASRENWRLASAFYIANSRDEAWEHVERGMMIETEYFCSVGLKMLYEAYPGQPYSEFTPKSIAEARNWVVGTPDDAIEWIEARLKETGGFGGVMLTAHEWAEHANIRRSMELFARHVIPHFRGHLADFQDEWSKLKGGYDRGVADFTPREGAANLTTL